MEKVDMEEDRTDVLVIGRACVDHLCVVNHYPVEDTKIRMTARYMEGGGQGATAACCIGRLGGKVSYVGVLGDDDDGRFCLERLEECHVNISQVKVVPGGHTPVAYVLITASNGKRTIVYEPGSLPDVVPDHTLMDLISHAKVLLLGPQATDLARSLKGREDFPPVVYDCERVREGLDDMMTFADYFIPHYGFLESEETGIEGSSKIEKIFSLDRMVAGRLIVTDGEHGAYFIEEGRLMHVRPPVIEVKDTTGAGDNFHGAFALAIARGFNITDAVRFSVTVASLSCRAYGGREGMPDYVEASAVMNLR
jgi:sulfofructose kinase